MKATKLLLLIPLLVVPLSSPCQTFNGRLTTSFYTWERQEPDKNSTQHLRAYQLLKLTIGELASPNLSLHTYFQASHDFSEKAKDDPRLWFYGAFLEWKNLFRVMDLRLGRQQVYAGVGYGTIDGFQLDYRAGKYVSLRGYAGLLPPLHKSGLGTWKEGHILGLHVTTTGFKRVRLGLSFVQKNRLPVEYSAPGIYTSTFRLHHPVSSLQQQLIGLDVWTRVIDRLTFSGRMDLNFAMRQIQRLEIEARALPTQKLDIGLDYIFRNPLTDLNSIFSVFAQESNNEIGLRVGYRFLRQMGVFGKLTTVVYEGDDAQRLILGFQFGQSLPWQGYLGYNKRLGYGGETDAVVGNLSVPVTKGLWVRLGSNLSSYRLVESVGDRQEALAFTLGLNYRMTSRLSLNAEGQALRNRSVKSDFRLFVRGSYWFSSD